MYWGGNIMSLRTKLIARGVVFTMSMVVAGWTHAAVPYSEDWSGGVGTNGWMEGTIATTVIRDVGFGNPADSLVLRRSLNPALDLSTTTDLAAVQGDYTGQPSWMVSFDVYHDIGNYTDTRFRMRYQNAGNNGWSKSVANAFPASWQSYSLMFDPSWSDAQAGANGWAKDDATVVSWQTLMTDVFHPEIRLVLGDLNSAIGHVDNFVLKAVPEPTTIWLAGVSILGIAMRRRSRGCDGGISTCRVSVG
jgi:hypothetical protein